MNLRWNFKKLRATAGGAAIEFALIAPVFLLLALGTIEFSRLNTARQVLLQGVRNSGSASYQTCRQLVVSSSCLAQASQIEEGYMTQELPGSELLVSHFQYDRNTGVVSRRGIYPGTGETTVNGYTSRYNFNDVKAIFDSMSTSETDLVIAESFLRQVGGTFIVKQYLSGKALYETALF